MTRCACVREGRVGAILGFGASLGDRLQNLRDAIERLQSKGVIIRAVSRIYESPHLGIHPGDSDRFPAHLNLAAAIETCLSPDGLLDVAQAVELAGGRTRLRRWGPRTIDIDVLSYDHLHSSSERLTLPHPGIERRGFVALPMLDVAPDYRLTDGTLLRDRISQEPLLSQPIAVFDADVTPSTRTEHKET